MSNDKYISQFLSIKCDVSEQQMLLDKCCFKCFDLRNSVYLASIPLSNKG